MSENRCVCCGAIIPEGSQVCVNCQKSAGVHKETPEEKFGSFMENWGYPIGTFVLIIVMYLLIRGC